MYYVRFSIIYDAGTTGKKNNWLWNQGKSWPMVQPSEVDQKGGTGHYLPMNIPVEVGAPAPG